MRIRGIYFLGLFNLAALGGALVALMFIQARLSDSADAEAARDITLSFPGVVSITPGPIPSLQRAVLASGEQLYVLGEQHFLIGNLFEVEGENIRNLTELDRRGRQLSAINELDDTTLLKFTSDLEKTKSEAVITVFTDVTCSYCSMLHQDVSRLNSAGISVRYVPYPRDGLGGAVAAQMEQIWCSAKPHDALAQAFQGNIVPGRIESDDCQSAISQGFEVGQRMGVTGTPAILLPNGELGVGYMPADALIAAVHAALEE